MIESNVNSKSNTDLIFLATLLGAVLIFFELWMATTNHENSRNQHLGTAVVYAKGHIDLLRPTLLGFNANGAPTPLEFPIWQACTAVLMKCFGIWHGLGNIVSLAFLFSSFWVLFDLCRRLNSTRTGWWALVFSLAQPLNLIVGGQAGADSTAWAFAMWFVYSSYRMMSEGRLSWWLLAICAGSLSAVTKAPFFFNAGLTAFFWLWLRFRHSGQAWLRLIFAGVISILVFMAWNIHCHHVYAEAEFPVIQLDPLDGKSGINKWYFGTVAYRLNPSNWLRGGWHLITMVFGGLSFLFLLLVSSRLKKSAEPWLWILAAVGTTLVFTPLILWHLHYFFIFAPATAWLCAIGATELESDIWSRLHASVFTRTTILLGTLAASLAGTSVIFHMNQYFDPYLSETGQLIKQHTLPEDKIIVWGMIWGDPFLTADRQGVTGSLSLTNTSLLNDPAKLERLKQLGYKKIVLINPSPYIVALTSATGQHRVTTSDLHQFLPAVARSWPVVFDSTQLLIVQIPD